MARIGRVIRMVSIRGNPVRVVLSARLLYPAALIWLILEVVVLILVGQQIGGLELFGLIALSALIGAIVVAKAGARAWRALRVDAAEGIVPGRDLGNPVIFLVAGLLLIFPGLLASVVALLAILVLPLTRAVIGAVFGLVFGIRTIPGVVPGQPMPGMGKRRGPGTSPEDELIRGDVVEGDIIDGEIIEETPPGDHPEGPGR